MADREKVIKGLEHCSENGCKGCPYETDCIMADGFSTLAGDVLDLLEAQEPRVMTLEEAQKAEIAWVEQIRTVVPAMRVATSPNGVMLFVYRYDGGVFHINIKPDYYGTVTRCWTSRPTDDQREATPWTA